MKYQIWYMRPEWFPDGTFGRLPDPQNLAKTHVHLLEWETEKGISDVWYAMQAENWSPNGEARELIESRGLAHTSMSVGDVIVDDVGNAHVVASLGFRAIGGVR